MTKLQKIKKWGIDRAVSYNKKRLKKAIKKYNKIKNDSDELVEQLIEQETESWKENKNKESVIKAKAYIAILLGCILLLLSFLADIYFSSVDLKGIKRTILDAALNIINIVISMVIGIGVSTIVLDFFSYVQYTRDRLKEIIVDKTFIKKLSDDEKRSIIFKAEESLYFKDGKILPNSLYADVKKKVIPLLDACYFSDFVMNISCDIDEKGGYVHKEILKHMTIISNEDGAEFKLPFSVYLRKTDGEDVEHAYDVVSCFFQYEDITQSFLERQVEPEVKAAEHDNQDNICYKEDYTFLLKKGENIIELRTRTTVPITDNVYMHTISLPCMNYSTTFSMNTEGYTVAGYGFALEDYSPNTKKKNVNYSRVGNSLTIRIDEWALPGEGSMFIIDRE